MKSFPAAISTDNRHCLALVVHVAAGVLGYDDGVVGPGKGIPALVPGLRMFGQLVGALTQNRRGELQMFGKIEARSPDHCRLGGGQDVYVRQGIPGVG